MRKDSIFDIATASTVDSTIWKNKKISWDDFSSRIKNPKVTTETFKEYKNLGNTKEGRAQQGRIKDVGGYFGGYLRNGKRSPKNVLHRQLITLDIDYGHENFWNDFKTIFNYEAILHITHSHSSENPRFRLLMPMSREVTTEEYIATSRKIAGLLGIENFDNTTFDINRLMFWPSVSSDVEYICKTQRGEWLDPDEILSMYVDWKDISEWPSNNKTKENRGEKQQDPSEKKGMIGAFCRAYTIEEAIEAFIPDYEKGENDRYTYKKGSTANGVIIYDSKFSYSHHGTDPASGILCNAFDLVRLHKFGDLDNTANSTKSFKAMEEFVRKDKAVKKLIAKEILQSSRNDFRTDADDEDDEIDADWMVELETDAKGKYLTTSKNLNLIFKNDPRLSNLFAYNVFDHRRYITRSAPWREVDDYDLMKNVDYAGARNYVECVYGISNSQKIDDVMSLEFDKNSFNPVEDYLTSLEWDGIERIDELLIDYFGAADNLYTREAIRKTLVGAVARIFRPGIKFDLMLTIVGGQGEGKSFFIKKLGKQWFSDTFMTVHGKDAYEQIQGAWIIEVAELAGLRKADVEAVKHFITKQEDTYRPAYHREPETFKRQCILIGTTNKVDFLRDPTGNRRFLPISTNKYNVKKNIFTELESEVDQIWAEAVALYLNGETLYISDEVAALANQEQNEHSEMDDRTGIVKAYLDTPLPLNWDSMDVLDRRQYIEDQIIPEETFERDYVCIAEIWCECFKKNKEDMSRYNTRDINDILRSLEDWEQKNSTKRFQLYGTQKYYIRKLI